MIGQSLGRYHILEQLGQGGMATVYKAFDTHVEREVAIKFIRSEKLEGKNAETVLKRFKRESQALAKLSHPNILTVLDYGEHEGQLYLVTEYLPGGSLKQKLGKPMHWAEAAKLLAPIARALGYAHSQRILHRDVKPANILLSPSGLPVLADFGIAKLLEGEETTELTRADVGIGTPEYMAPEQGKGKADARSDVYSLGVVFYELVTGRKPYTADTPLAVLLMHATDPLPRPKQFVRDLPESVEKVVFKALAKKPQDRFQDMATFAAALESSGLDQKTKRSRSAIPKWIVPLTATGLVIVALIAAGVWFAPNQPAAATPSPTTIADAIHTQRAIALATNSVLSTNIALTPTATPVPTNTPLPTNTPTPTPKPLGDGQLNVARVVRSESFDNVSKLSFGLSGNKFSIQNGLLTLTDTIVDGTHWEDGSSGMKSLFSPTNGNATVMLFRSYQQAHFIASYERGGWAATNYRAFWFGGDSKSPWYWAFYNGDVAGGTSIAKLSWNVGVNVKYGAWYYLLIKLNSDGVMESRLWERDNPKIVYKMSENLGEEFARNTFSYSLNVAQGTVEVDEFQEVELAK